MSRCSTVSGDEAPTFAVDDPAVGPAEEVLPRRFDHLGEVKDRDGAFWVGRRALLG